MKKVSILFSFSSLILFAFSCGPAAEDRQNMHARAKVVADSIANMIKTKMAEAEAVSQSAPASTIAPADSSKNPVTPH